MSRSIPGEPGHFSRACTVRKGKKRKSETLGLFRELQAVQCGQIIGCDVGILNDEVGEFPGISSQKSMYAMPCQGVWQ